jgi:hypothetical protein
MHRKNARMVNISNMVPINFSPSQLVDQFISGHLKISSDDRTTFSKAPSQTPLFIPIRGWYWNPTGQFDHAHQFSKAPAFAIEIRSYNS